MEFFLHLWDELDDWTGACRHLAGAAVAEVAVLAAPFATASSAITLWLLMPQFRVGAALLGFTATFWGAYRQLLRLAAS
jgi:hypothetical protein